MGSIYGSVCPHLTSARLAPRERSKDSERASGAQTYLKGDLKRNRIKAVIIFSTQVLPRSEEREKRGTKQIISNVSGRAKPKVAGFAELVSEMFKVSFATYQRGLARL